jgi:hypothetical protein
VVDEAGEGGQRRPDGGLVGGGELVEGIADALGGALPRLTDFADAMDRSPGVMSGAHPGGGCVVQACPGPIGSVIGWIAGRRAGCWLECRTPRRW